MRNKIREITYFICLAVLFWVNFCCNNAYSQKSAITGQLIHNNYNIPTDDIERLFKDKLSNENNIVYTKVPRGLIVSIDSTMFFRKGDDELIDSAKPLLHHIADILRVLDNKCIVESNSNFETFENSTYHSNWELSIVQAEKIVDYLIKTEKINPGRISAVGYGEMMPFKQKNRYNENFNQRIDFVIINYEKVELLN